jgi:hypothetical protein
VGDDVSRSSAFPSTGSELLDWQEVWCFRCIHDHGVSHGPEYEDGTGGCDIMLRAAIDEDTPEVIQSGYVVVFEDEDGDCHEHTIPNVCNSLPAAAFCTHWEPCKRECRQHVNGAVIVELRRTDEVYS